MNEARPDPDQLLAHVQAEEARAQARQAAHLLRRDRRASARPTRCSRPRATCAPSGVDVVVGYVEPHGRVETERLLEGLEQLPTLPVQLPRHRAAGVRSRRGLAAPARDPLVDELAHSNLIEGDPPPRHAEALAGHRGAARCRHQRLDHGQRPASGEPERPRRADHRRAPARDPARPHLRRGGRGRADRSAAGRSARAAARRARSTCRRRRAPRSSASSASPI